ncbi:MAG: hypothetical protein ACUVQF_00475 [Fervidobacterium sp.]|uniref:hypothetical protein n=1 Tax=Fervidobacterium sp. TaxID=1871331 RepID=UPI00404B264A
MSKILNNYYFLQFDEYLHKQLKEKFGTLLIFFVLMLYPGSGNKTFGAFFIIIFSILSDIKNKRLDLLTFLPYSRKNIFWFEFAFTSLLILLSFFIGLPFYKSFQSFLVDIATAMIFYSAYYGLSIALTCGLKIDPYGSIFLVLLVDAVLSSLGKEGVKHLYNPYRLISPLRQENMLLSFVFAVICVYLGYIAFSKKGAD